MLEYLWFEMCVCYFTVIPLKKKKVFVHIQELNARVAHDFVTVYGSRSTASIYITYELQILLFMIRSLLLLSAVGIGCGSTVTLTRINRLLKTTERMVEFTFQPLAKAPFTGYWYNLYPFKGHHPSRWV